MAKYRSRLSRDIRLVDAFRLDWQKSLKEVQAYTDSKINGKDFDEKIEAVKLLFDVKAMYNTDDIDGYLRLLDQNRAILKSDPYSQAIGSIADATL